MKQRHLYRWAGDHVAYRDASEYVTDPRDMVNGQPPAWHLRIDRIEKLPDEIEFDHPLSSDELSQQQEKIREATKTRTVAAENAAG